MIYGNMGFWVGLLRVLAAARLQASLSFQFWVGLLRVLTATALELKVKNFILQDPNTYKVQKNTIY